MPPPPPPPGPPPAPGPPPPSSAPRRAGGGGGGGDKGALLKSIQKGKSLKKTVTNDRSTPLVGGVKAASPAPGGGGGGGASQGSGGGSLPSLPGIGGLFSGGMPALKKTNGGVSTGRKHIDLGVGRGGGLSALGSVRAPQSEPTPPNKWGGPAPSSSNSSLNSSPSMSPSPSPVSSSQPRAPSVRGRGAQHPTSRPPPPPSPGNKAGPPPVPPASNNSQHYNSLRNAPNREASKSFNNGPRNQPATIGPGHQGRPALPNTRVSQDDSSIRNGKLSGPPPPPPVRTVSSRGAPPPPPQGAPNRRPSQPPPPPPSNPPRPPQHRELPPPPPNHSSGDPPPTPPTRVAGQSMRPPAPGPPPPLASSGGDGSFEARFQGKFRNLQYLPPPEQFHRCAKTYPSTASSN